jgi:Holliday junction resolvase-like predicted endonuclease
MNKKRVGAWGEEQGREFLKRHGFAITASNFFTSRGEVDIVAQKGNDFYFIEVKTREAGPMATDLAVTPFKQRKFKRAVAKYCLTHNIGEGFGQICATLLVAYQAATRRVSLRLAAWR